MHSRARFDVSFGKSGANEVYLGFLFGYHPDRQTVSDAPQHRNGQAFPRRPGCQRCDGTNRQLDAGQRNLIEQIEAQYANLVAIEPIEGRHNGGSVHPSTFPLQ